TGLGRSASSTSEPNAQTGRHGNGIGESRAGALVLQKTRRILCRAGPLTRRRSVQECAARQAKFSAALASISFFRLDGFEPHSETQRRRRAMRRRWTVVLLLAMLASASWAQIPTK